MMETGHQVLSTLIFFPIIGGVLMLLLARRNERLIKFSALFFSIFTFLLSIPLLTNFDKTTHLMQFTERRDWIPVWGIEYSLGVDGISLLFVLLSTLITILCVLISWNSVRTKVKEFYISLLLIEGAMIGVFCSLDFFLFYIFWEAMLIPMYLIIGIWGGERRIYAAIKFFLFTFVGSVLMLIGIIVLYIEMGTFDIIALSGKTIPFAMQLWLFWAFFAAFAVKVPMFPLHTWLPDAHTEAPTAGSVILAAVLIKMGAYGFLRFSIPILPEAAKAMTPVMLGLSVVAIIYGGLVCFAQTDLKRLIAYSSVSHMGFVTLGIFALNVQGVEGGILQMINHGVITGALFLSIGVIYERTHTREIADYGGLAGVMPVYAGFFMLFALASIGLPGLNGFVGEFLIILGGFKASKPAGIFAATGIIIGAGYMLWLYQRIFFTGLNEKLSGIAPMRIREAVTLLTLAVLVLWIGLYPNTFLGFMHESVKHLLDEFHKAGSSTMIAAGSVSEAL